MRARPRPAAGKAPDGIPHLDSISGMALPKTLDAASRGAAGWPASISRAPRKAPQAGPGSGDACRAAPAAAPRRLPSESGRAAGGVPREALRRADKGVRSRDGQPAARFASEGGGGLSRATRKRGDRSGRTGAPELTPAPDRRVCPPARRRAPARGGCLKGGRAGSGARPGLLGGDNECCGAGPPRKRSEPASQRETRAQGVSGAGLGRREGGFPPAGFKGGPAAGRRRRPWRLRSAGAGRDSRGFAGRPAGGRRTVQAVGGNRASGAVPSEY